MTVPLFPVLPHHAAVREAQLIFVRTPLLSFIARLWMCLLSSSPRGRQARFVFFQTEQSASEILGRRISELRWVARKQAHLDIPVFP